MADAAEDAPWDPVAVAATRRATFKAFRVPFWTVAPIVGVPIVVSIATQNPFWLALMIPLIGVVRWLVARDHNRFRVLRLALSSGAMFADRNRWGGATVDPLGEVHRDH